MNGRFAQYCLSTGAWSQPFDGYSDGFNPGPYSLMQHVISCCIRNVWYATGPILCVSTIIPWIILFIYCAGHSSCGPFRNKGLVYSEGNQKAWMALLEGEEKASHLGKSYSQLILGLLILTA